MSDNNQQFVKASTNNSGAVSSNLEFIKTRMSKIDNITKRSADFCLEKHTVDSANSGNQLFSKINDVMNIYYNAQLKLMEKLNSESKVIVEIGETYEALDKEVLASKVGDL